MVVSRTFLLWVGTERELEVHSGDRDLLGRLGWVLRS